MSLSGHDSRRQFLVTAAGKTFAGVAAGCQLLTGYDLQPQTVNAFGVQPEPDQNESAVNLHSWQKDGRNPVFVPESEFDQRGAQAPFVVRHQNLWWMFYAGIGKDHVQRICLATASPQSPTEWERHGPVLQPGGPDAFDELSLTYPCVHRIGGKWHLYYSGRSRRDGAQHFSAYWGIGLATSDDLLHWEKNSRLPVLQGDGIAEYPACQALVGLGNILEIPQSDGRVLYRMYYTVLPGRKDPDWQKNGTWNVIEHKVIAAAHSTDGICWTDRQRVLERRMDVTTENVGVVGMQVWKTADERIFRGLYAGLGTRFGTYSLAECVSDDGLIWSRGPGDQNVSLTPKPGSWDSGMTGYPAILDEGDTVRIFYNGASGGATGIGMLAARKL